MAILISQATSNSSNILSLGSNEATNTFFGTNLADHVNYWGTGNFTMPDVSTGDTIDISLPSLLTSGAKAAATAALNGNTVTFAVDGHTYAFGGIADGDSISVNFSGGLYGAPQMTITRTGDSFFVSNTFFSVGSTLLVNGTTGVTVFDSTAPTASVTAATIQPSGNAVVRSTEGGTAYLVKDSVTFTDAMPIFAAGDNNFNGATVSASNTDTNVAATGLVDGTYKVYTVDGSGNLSSASTNSVIVDGTAPVFQSAATSTDGAKVILTYNGALSATMAAAAAFNIQVGGSGNAVTAVTVNGSTVELTLTSAVTNGQAVTVAYTDSTAGDDANAIQDTVGNDAVTLTAQTVTNSVADTIAPTASVTTAKIQPTGNAVVQSTEAGTAYLVKDSVTVSNETSITGASDANFNSAAISTANTNTNVAATGLADGTYKVYTVDASGNLSSVSTNSVIVDGTAPTASALGVANSAALTATNSEIGTAGVYAASAGTLISSVATNAGGAGVVNVVAQNAITNATLKVIDAVGNEASTTASVILGATGNDGITEASVGQLIFGFAGADAFTLKAGTVSSSTLSKIADYTVNSASESIVSGGTAVAWATAVSGWTINNGVVTKASATVSDFYADFAGATGVAGEVAAFVDGGNTYIFGEGVGTGDADNTAVVLVGITGITAVATTAAANTVLIG